MQNILSCLTVILVLMVGIGIGYGFSLRKRYGWLFVGSGFAVGFWLAGDDGLGARLIGGSLLGLFMIIIGPISLRRRTGALGAPDDSDQE